MLSRLLVFAVAAAWLASSTCSARNDVLLMSPERVSEKLTFQPIVPFDTAHATRLRYKSFIENVREEMLLISGDKVHGIERLPKPGTLPLSDRYLQVALYNFAGTRLLLAIDKLNANVVGYRSENKAYFFPDTNVKDTELVFQGFKRFSVPFDSSYSDMERIAGPRSNISLGMGALNTSIQYIFNQQASYLAQSLLVAIQMVSDAVRYRYVENMVVEHITDDVESSAFLPTATMIGLADNWKVLSTRIQESVAGIINPGLVLPGVSNPITSIYPTLGPQIAVILYVCDICTKTEPTVNLIGRNDLCAGVQDSLYYNGNPIILEKCKTTNNENQLFKLMNDGTIRCKEKCLTAYRAKAGRYVMIHDCATTAPQPNTSSIIWEIQDNGNIINKQHKLALNAYVGYRWSVLTVDEISYSSRQGWSFRNSTDLLVTPILNNGMYMQASAGNSSVQVVKGNDKNVPQWQIYPDGTFRPSTTNTSCLARKSSPDDTIVGLHSCDGGKAERWLFNPDGSISDATSDYVLEVNKNQEIVVVKRSADTPTTKQIFEIKFP